MHTNTFISDVLYDAKKYILRNVNMGKSAYWTYLPNFILQQVKQRLS
ncbi:uncharacterized protein ANIA_11618 [Aspergillus nidulans FGSC A4]|uniref:Uncharacterized protein n=1 Tax=Emericella nidulans (strain FGSC A4 / ATCC 38163 / CBS 112.46 / NRRL 194 / M139) TaxID=227321 RepID=C8VEP9_EMENI|nr:hypothetical protein [Aspergillus nidulans FGSC A4]CBF80742.1 TPA: hypothetical protein ANIA_11618 [Aspergillus nidulans FGSC A4]